MRIRFGPASILGSLGGMLVGAGIVLIRVGYDLEELSWIARIFAPSGHPAVFQGATLITVGLVVILISALHPRSRRRAR
jgi:hypothetical protein